MFDKKRVHISDLFKESASRSCSTVAIEGASLTSIQRIDDTGGHSFQSLMKPRVQLGQLIPASPALISSEQSNRMASSSVSNSSPSASSPSYRSRLSSLRANGEARETSGRKRRVLFGDYDSDDDNDFLPATVQSTEKAPAPLSTPEANFGELFEKQLDQFVVASVEPDEDDDIGGPTLQHRKPLKRNQIEKEERINRPQHDLGEAFEAEEPSAYRPSPSIPRHGPLESLYLPSISGDSGNIHSVNSYLASCLMPHQISGVRWLWSKYASSQGGILSDDMGLGKTVQIVSLLSAIYSKTGMAAQDQLHNKNKRRGRVSSDLPCSLIICPATVISNWCNELNKWGYFLQEALEDARSSSETILKAKDHKLDVVLGSYEKMCIYAEDLASVRWNIVVWDEGHMLNNDKNARYHAAISMGRVRSRFVLSGTPIQNRLSELWCLLNLVTHKEFQDKKSFDSHFSEPIKRSKKASASEEAVARGQEREVELQRLLKQFLLKRMKEDELADVLKGKKEIIVFCELSELQKKLYQHILSLPDFQNVALNSEPCSCGSGLKRSVCCEENIVPIYREGITRYSGSIDPRAALWRLNHPDDQACPKCPTCLVLPGINKLSRVASHPSLLQASPILHSALNEKKREDLIEFSTRALPPDILNELGGPFQATDFLTISNPKASGKMTTLQMLLDKFTSCGEKVLVFSYSTKVLDIIECLLKSKGWSFSRLDGGVSSKQRQGLIDSFNSTPSKLIFLLSTKAGGMGINLVSANKVIQFDVCWNPAADQQSQDRAYRLGQLREVTVYRLVAQGTIEEMMYMRQLYKNCLTQAALGGRSSSSSVSTEKETRFEGVQGDTSCYGELFGAFNLFQYHDGSILQRLRDKYLHNGDSKDDPNLEDESATGVHCMRNSTAESLVRKSATEAPDTFMVPIDSPMASSLNIAGAEGQLPRRAAPSSRVSLKRLMPIPASKMFPHKCIPEKPDVVERPKRLVSAGGTEVSRASIEMEYIGPSLNQKQCRILPFGNRITSPCPSVSLRAPAYDALDV